MLLGLLTFAAVFKATNAATYNVSGEVLGLSNDLEDAFCNVLHIGGDYCDNYGIQDYIDSLSDYFADGDIDASDTADAMMSILNAKIQKRISMINNITNALEAACKFDLESAEIPDFDSLYFGGSDALAAKLPSDMEYSDVYGMDVSMDHSVLRVPEDVDIDSENVQFDAQLTYLLDNWNIFTDNLDQLGEEYDYNTCYFGTVNGVFRIHPGRETTKNDDGTYKSYDPRYRPWYVTAASGAKDVIILVDTSGSMENYNRMTLAKEAVTSILNTLGQQSFVGVVGFNTELEYTCFGETMVRATDDNIAELETWVNALSPKGSTNFGDAFEAAFNMLDQHTAAYNRSCTQASIIFLTDGVQNEGTDARTVVENRMTDDMDVVVFSYTLGSGADASRPKALAEMTDGIYTHIADNDDSLATTMSSFYLYYSYGLEFTELSTELPFISFSTGAIQVTLAKPVYINDSFVGVTACDLPLEEIDNSVGDYGVGYKSYFFIVDTDGASVIHPYLPDYSEYEDGTLTEAVTTDITNLEPAEFTSSGLRDTVLAATSSGYQSISATVKQPAGDVGYDGYVQFTQQLLYLYEPIPDTSFVFVLVVYTEDSLSPPNVPDFGLSSVPQSICNHSYTSYDELSACRWGFNMNCRLDLAMDCSDDISYIDMSGIEQNTDQSSYFFNQTFSSNYTCWHLTAGLYTDTTDALTIDPTCDEFAAQYKYTNRETVSASELPFSGFRSDSTANLVETLSVFQQFWRPEYYEADSTFHAAWVGIYDGTHISYPAKVFSASYVNTERPWYQRAISFPTMLTFSTPYAHAVTGTTVLSGSTVVTAPQSSYTFGVAGFDFVFSEFITFVEDSLPSCLESTNECYLVDSSAFVLYYDGISSVDDDELSNIFLGNLEPTLMQELVDSSLGFFEMESFVNYESYSYAIAYKANHDVYESESLNTVTRSFDLNSGEFTVHWIERSNIYLIFIEDYNVSNKSESYPAVESGCGDGSSVCPDVYLPGCATDDNGDCQSWEVDVCNTPDTLEVEDICNTIDIPDKFMALLEAGATTDCCALLTAPPDIGFKSVTIGLPMLLVPFTLFFTLL